ncbi:hypothetical protein mRhiFer1_009472 [Rhinolophus ferrumequinum]|uniref:Uncharacterized protein n=1 Tax=Rhinolophus ferrumequinum TaxID=59479 RepID=A0A7J7RF87_RHIFE|nr:hypothetical protein mRhiFer1_009472 [Rhinolophus ferrumequinum]
MLLLTPQPCTDSPQGSVKKWFPPDDTQLQEGATPTLSSVWVLSGRWCADNTKVLRIKETQLPAGGEKEGKLKRLIVDCNLLIGVNGWVHWLIRSSAHMDCLQFIWTAATSASSGAPWDSACRRTRVAPHPTSKARRPCLPHPQLSQEMAAYCVVLKKTKLANLCRQCFIIDHTVTLSTSLMDVSPPFSLSCGNSRSSNHCSHKHQGLTLLPNHYDNYLPVFSVKFDANKFWKTSVEDGRGTR